MSKYTLAELKRILIGRNVFFFKLLDDFPKVEYVAGIDAGYFAANIAMAYRHFKFKEPAGTTSVFTNPAPYRNVMPVQRQGLPSGSIVLGAGNTDTFWTAGQIKQFGVSQGYTRSEVAGNFNFDAIKDLISQRHAPIVALDVNAHGGPGYYGGANAQWCVILGFAVFKDGQEFVVATHSWGGYYIWAAQDLIASNVQLLSLPTVSTQMQMVGSPAIPVAQNTGVVSLNDVRNKIVVIKR